MKAVMAPDLLSIFCTNDFTIGSGFRLPPCWNTRSSVRAKLTLSVRPALWFRQRVEHIGCSKSNVSYLWKPQQMWRAHHHHVIEQILSSKTLLLDTVTPLAVHFPQQPACRARNELHQWRGPTVTVATAGTRHPPPPRRAAALLLITLPGSLRTLLPVLIWVKYVFRQRLWPELGSCSLVSGRKSLSNRLLQGLGSDLKLQ